MISISKANKILENLFGRVDMDAPKNIYLGLAANKPDRDGTIKGEQKTGGSRNYARVNVGGSSTEAGKFFGDSATYGKISNSDEIKFNTAKAAYDEKMMYWFLSESVTGGTAFLWGRLKDVLYEKGTRDFTAGSEISNTYIHEEDVDDLLNLADATDYVVWWRNPADSKDKGKEYDVKSSLYEKDGKTYVHLGNPLIKGGESDGTPFGILYNQETVGAETTGHIKVYSTVLGTSFEVAVYGLGLEVKKATVPTFYQYELTASIEVQTDN